MAAELSPREFARSLLLRARRDTPGADRPPGRATPRNTAQPNHAFDKTNPRPPRLGPRQVTAARLLLAGRRVMDVAAELGVHPYTVSRWKRNPLFDAELRRQADRVTARITAAPQRNKAQQEPTAIAAPPQNEPNAANSA